MQKLTVAAALAAAFLLVVPVHAESNPDPMWTIRTTAEPASARPSSVVLKARHGAAGIDRTTTSGIPPRGSKSAYGALIARHAASNGVPLALAHAVIRVESNYRANARGAAGEIGLMQIKPATARMLGYRGTASGLFDPATNLKYGMKYLGKAHRLGGGSVCGTILKYNAGHGARRMNPVSAAYCGKVKRQLSQG
ncbi:MAG: transglycosylase SLT domain-containing protein [Rhizobiaceae bacterium]